MGVFVVALPKFRKRYDYIIAHMQSRFGSNFEVFGVLGVPSRTFALTNGVCHCSSRGLRWAN
jgi:agmatine/peptidylarginine deiminase